MPLSSAQRVKSWVKRKKIVTISYISVHVTFSYVWSHTCSGNVANWTVRWVVRFVYCHKRFNLIAALSLSSSSLSIHVWNMKMRFHVAFIIVGLFVCLIAWTAVASALAALRSQGCVKSQVQNALKPFRLSSKYVRWPLRNELRTWDQEMRTHKKLINNVSLHYD